MVILETGFALGAVCLAIAFAGPPIYAAWRKYQKYWEKKANELD
jgi:hypothetical protein